MVDEGIPVPDRRYGPAPKIEWHRLQVGDSILVTPEAAGKRALASAHRYAKKVWIVAYRCGDGFLVHPPLSHTPKTLSDYQKEFGEAEKTHGKGRFTILARKVFTGRQQEGGWRIWRTEDEPIRHEDTFEVPGIPGRRFIKNSG